MADTLTGIQSDAQHYANDSQLNIVTGQGARVFHQLYRGMCSPAYRHGFRQIGMVHIGRRWRELLKTEDLSTVTSGTSKYTWDPTATFIDDQFKIFMVDASASNEEVEIDRVTDLLQWTREKSTSNSFPAVYMLYNDGTNDVLEFRPTPDNSSDTIRIWGYTEPSSLSAAAATVFIGANSDKALSGLVAADYLAKRGKTQRASEVLDEVIGLLPRGDRGTMINRQRLRATDF